MKQQCSKKNKYKYKKDDVPIMWAPNELWIDVVSMGCKPTFTNKTQ